LWLHNAGCRTWLPEAYFAAISGSSEDVALPAVYLDHLGSALGGRKAHVNESESAGILASSGTDLLAAGFEWHYLCDDDESVYDLARAAVNQMPEGSLQTGADAIIYSTCLPGNGNIGDVEEWRSTGDVRHLMEFPASRLQADLELDRAAVIGLTQQGCTGLLGSLRLAGALLATEPDWTRVLCVTADRFPSGSTYEQAYNLISDGAAACIVSREPSGFRLLGSEQITNGGLATATGDQSIGSYFSYTQLLVNRTLQRCGLAAADIAWVVPQNTNAAAWQILARLLGIDHARVWLPSLPESGHAISADNIINLAALVASGRLRSGDRVLLLVAGHGLNWQSILLEAVA
jgi:3-oxoacyl-[acyl-carrier-protein] synthase-3